jgi:hypothetical protein
MRTAVAIRDPLPWHQLVLTAELAERSGYEALFVPEIMGREAFATLGGLARATHRLRLATGVLPVTSRSRDLLAMGAATVQELSLGRFILGLGAGEPVPGALDRVRSTIQFVRAALDGKEVAASEDDPEPFQLSISPGSQPVPIWLAALGPNGQASLTFADANQNTLSIGGFIHKGTEKTSQNLGLSLTLLGQSIGSPLTLSSGDGTCRVTFTTATKSAVAGKFVCAKLPATKKVKLSASGTFSGTFANGG